MCYCASSLQRGTPGSKAVDQNNNHPHIVCFVGDVAVQYFVAIEQELLIECKSMTNALYTMLATHFVFNITIML